MLEPFALELDGIFCIGLEGEVGAEGVGDVLGVGDFGAEILDHEKFSFTGWLRFRIWLRCLFFCTRRTFT